MKNKILLQLFLSLIILTLIIFFYNIYFLDKKSYKDSNIENLETINTIEQKANTDTKKSNIMQEIAYSSLDKQGNQYLIKARLGEIKKDQPNLIFMGEVSAIINIKNSSPLMIYSDKAIYNSLNYDTNFYENVLIQYTNSSVISNNLDLDFKNNLAIISNNIIYKNLNTKLLADKVEIDLISKNSKIFMNNSKKIKVISIK